MNDSSPIIFARAHDVSDNSPVQKLFVSNTNSRICSNDEWNIRIAAKQNNARNGITGVLVRSNNHYIQVLEGMPDAVTATMDRIRADKRHKNVTVIAKAPCPSVMFLDWRMLFEREGRVDEVVTALRAGRSNLSQIIGWLHQSEFSER